MHFFNHYIKRLSKYFKLYTTSIISVFGRTYFLDECILKNPKSQNPDEYVWSKKNKKTGRSMFGNRPVSSISFVCTRVYIACVQCTRTVTYINISISIPRFIYFLYPGIWCIYLYFLRV